MRQNASNAAILRASFAAPNAAGQMHSYQVIYAPLTGKLQVWRDSVFLGSWTDAPPLPSGGYLSLRTDAANVLFDDLVVAEVIKYYTFGGQRSALRRAGTLNYLLRDHLGSTSVSYNTSTGAVSAQRYTPYGAPRGPASTLPTDYRPSTALRMHFTGQRSEEAGLGSLYDYNARFYSPALGRFLQADTLVPSPGNPQSLNRYAYVLNNPLRYTDPTGHAPAAPNCAGIPDCGVDGWYGYQEYAVRKHLQTERDRHAKQLSEAVLGLASVIFEPADYATTLGGCLGGDCSVPGLVGMVIPGVSGAVGKQVAKHADEIIGATNEVAQKRIVIGEGMEAVKTAAREHDAKWYQAWSKNFKKENFDLAESLRRNERWIRDKVKQGYEILDIGLDPSRATRSSFYALEKRILEKLGYPVIPIERP